MNRSIEDAASFIRSKSDHSPSIGIITGSGWDMSSLLSEKRDEILYQNIPGFPRPTVKGHHGAALLGIHKGIEIILLQGRVHYYEGYDMEEITYPVEVLSALGVETIILTTSAGGIRSYLKPGDFMLITDHINLMGVPPLRGLSKREGYTRFVDMSQAYDKRLINSALESGANLGISVHCGVLAAVSGPSYETPAEIQMIRMLGADAVCMSTVPEVIMSKYLGLKVLGISIITNYAAGLSPSSLHHEDAVLTAGSRKTDACRLISAVIENADQYMNMPR